MSKRSVLSLALPCLAGLVAAMLAVPAHAQQEAPPLYTYVASWGVPRTQWNDFEKALQQDRATMERLVADGTLVSWGDAASLVHTEDGYTHYDWFQATSVASILKTLETLSASARGPAYASLKHSDVLLNTKLHGGKTTPTTPGYLFVALWQVKPGESEHFEQIAKNYLKPWLDGLVADGTMLSYNFDTEQIHTGPPGSYALAVMFKDATGPDKYYASLQKVQHGDPLVGQVFIGLVELKEHRDIFARILAYQHK